MTGAAEQIRCAMFGPKTIGATKHMTDARRAMDFVRDQRSRRVQVDKVGVQKGSKAGEGAGRKEEVP